MVAPPGASSAALGRSMIALSYRSDGWMSCAVGAALLGGRGGGRRLPLGAREMETILHGGMVDAPVGVGVGVRPAPAVRPGAREPAAADRLRHGAVPDPH